LGLSVQPLRGLNAFGFVLLACAPAGPSDAGPDAMEQGRQFSTDRATRRAALENSLIESENAYARERLQHYAVEGAWDELPELRPRVGAIVVRGDAIEIEPVEALFARDVEWTESAILELGALAFRSWPAQLLPTLELEFANQAAGQVVAKRGLWTDATGAVGGLVLAEYDSGSSALAATCASCHSAVNRAGERVDGPASDIELSDGSNVDGWGPGTVDVTADAVDNPVAMPDLRATVHQSRLHWSGNLRNDGLALAVRIDTLLITNGSALARPPRQLAFALAYYIEQLGSGSRGPRNEGRGAELFEVECQRCHDRSDGAGDWVSAETVGTDPRVAGSPSRGTGGYRVPSLFRVAQRSRLTHLGWELDLSEFLSPERVERYPGHAFGLDLDDAEREALVEHVRAF
jgi:cytochrome c2